MARDYLPGLLTDSAPEAMRAEVLEIMAEFHVTEELHAQIPGSTLVVIEGVGHLSNVETPERFNAEVRAFLAPGSATPG